MTEDKPHFTIIITAPDGNTVATWEVPAGSDGKVDWEDTGIWVFPDADNLERAIDRYKKKD